MSEKNYENGGLKVAPSVYLKALSVVDKILVDALVDPSTVSLSNRLEGMS